MNHGTQLDRAAGVARQYAEAIHGLAAPAGQAEAVLEELRAVADLLAGQPELGEMLASPIVPEARKLAVIERIFTDRLSELAFDALRVIARRGRMGILPAIVRALAQQLNRQQGAFDVEVTTAVPLDEATRWHVLERVRGMVAGEPILHERVDGAILGGLIIRVGDRVLDASVRRELEGYDKQLRRPGARRGSGGQEKSTG